MYTLYKDVCYVYKHVCYVQCTLYIVGNDRNFGSVRGSADFGRFGSAKILPNFLSF